LCAKYGLQSLHEKRLKQSTVNGLNDPFELMCYDVADFAVRMAFLQTRDQVDKVKGVLCFSENWKNPVIWAHYGDDHKGLCLGFEIPEITGDPEDECDKVNYEPKPLPFPTNFEEMSESERTAFVRKVIFTKYEHWVYENEIRVWAPLQPKQENGLRFVEFGENLRIVEVIIGARCKVTPGEITEALGTAAGQVKIVRVRAAYDRFEMVEDKS
jgi:hypothetical protein